MKRVEIYTDGACKGNPGPGGYGAILVYGGKERVLSGGEPSTTNNRMELTAAIAALERLREPCEVTLTSDSRYLVDGVTKGWARSWQRNGWKKADKSPALNSDLWARLLELLETHRVTFVWVRGHKGHPYNERCDARAVEAARRGAAGKYAGPRRSARAPILPASLMREVWFFREGTFFCKKVPSRALPRKTFSAGKGR